MSKNEVWANVYKTKKNKENAEDNGLKNCVSVNLDEVKPREMVVTDKGLLSIDVGTEKEGNIGIFYKLSDEKLVELYKQIRKAISNRVDTTVEMLDIVRYKCSEKE